MSPVRSPNTRAVEEGAVKGEGTESRTSQIVDYEPSPKDSDCVAARTLVCVPASLLPSPPSLLERVERALVLLAHFIELDGDVHVPMYERLEAELLELRRRETTKERARRLLLNHTSTRSAMRSSRTAEPELPQLLGRRCAKAARAE